MGESRPGPTFYRVVVPPGTVWLVAADRTPWPAHLAIADELLAQANPEVLTHGDGMVRFQPEHGSSALYGYAHPAGPRTRHYDLVRSPA